MTIEQWIGVGLLVTTITTVIINIVAVLNSIRKGDFDKLQAMVILLEGRVDKLERKLKAALTANTKMKTIIQDLISLLEEIIEVPVIPDYIKAKAHELIIEARKQLSEAELLLLDSISLDE